MLPQPRLMQDVVRDTLMEAASVVSYMAALAALTLAPGPLVAVLAARSATNDRRGACALAVGMCMADISIILAICAGLSVWLQAHPEIFAGGQFAGAGLLLWLAVRIWVTAGISANPQSSTSGIVVSGIAGFALCLSSPQTVLMYLFLLPSVVDLSVISVGQTMMLITVTIAALSDVFIAIIVFADMTQRLLHSSTGVILWARGTSLAIGASATGLLFW